MTTPEASQSRPWFKRPIVVVPLIAFGVIVLFFTLAAAGSSDETAADTTTTTTLPTTTTSAPEVEKMVWSILVGPEGEKTGEVTLTGELPNGYPTETIIEDRVISYDPEGDFAWDLKLELPSPIVPQFDMDCDQLSTDVDFWLDGAADAVANDLLDSAARQTAYAQNAIDLQNEKGCT